MDRFAINVFVHVADARSFVAAGRLLGISASGIGKSITRLEQNLGVRMFHRSTRSVTLTAEGSTFLEHARRIRDEFDAAEAELTQTSSEVRGRLRIGFPLIGEPFLEVLTAFQQQYPEVELDLEFDNRKVDVIEEGFDAVVRSGSAEDSQLSSRLVGSFRMLVVGAPSYFERHGTPFHPSDLAQHACIQFRMPNTGKLQIWQLRRADGEPEYRLPTRMTCNSNEARLRFALAGAGIAYMSDYSVQQAMANGALVSVLEEYATEKNVFRLLWPSGKHITPKLRAFIDFLSKRFAEQKSREA
jgi:DNA-binding transcriptional LysR family regulator